MDEEFPVEVALEWSVEDLLIAARFDPSLLDSESVKTCSDRLADAIGARQERTTQ